MRVRIVFAGMCIAAVIVVACVGDEATPSPSGTDAGGDAPAPPAPPPPPPGSTDSGPDAAAPITLASGQAFPVNLFVLGDTIYWTNAGGAPSGCTDTPNGSVMSAKIDGSGSPVTIATGLKCPAGIFVTSDKVYWTERGTPGMTFNDGSIGRANHDGSTPEQVITAIQFPFTVKVQGDQAYYFTGPANGVDQLWRVSVTGGTAIDISKVLPSAAAMSVDGTWVYWAEDTSGNVWRLPFDADGGDAGRTHLGVNQGGPAFPIPSADDNTVYWFNRNAAGAIVKHDVATSTDTVLAQNITPNAGGRQFTVDDTYAYYTSATSTPGRVRLDSTAPATPDSIAPTITTETQGLFVTADSIYIATVGATGTIYRIKK